VPGPRVLENNYKKFENLYGAEVFIIKKLAL